MNDVANNITAQSKFKLPATQEVRTSLANSLGFKTIAEVREIKKNDPRAPQAKEYQKKVREAAEVIEAETSYPNVTTIPVDTLQEKIAGDARLYHRIAILAARRKGEEMPIRMSFTIFDLMDIDDGEDDGEYDKDNIALALDAFCKARGLNETSALLVQAAVVGTKNTMLKLRKYFKVLGEAQDKFVSWLAENEIADVDFDGVSFWMKRQSKRLQSAIQTPEIDESQISI